MSGNQKFWIVFSLFGCFVLGVIAGVLLDENVLDVMQKKRRDEQRQATRFPSLNTMADELALTEEQREQIRDIFKRNDERLHAIREKYIPEFTSIRTLLIEEINNVLNDAQKQQFENMIQRHDEQRRREADARKRYMEKREKEKQGKKDSGNN
ncbi:MAG: hypothetical protein KJ908_00050 [Acidobacteria bacterium]|nr:hypothetical protein [Acidobacteriota bacterium]MBU1475447.1 hypothetical protein [Acidobacteriota bacterium]